MASPCPVTIDSRTSPAEVLDADFRLRAGAQRFGELFGPKTPLEPHGRSEPSESEATRRTGEPAGRGLLSRGARKLL